MLDDAIMSRSGRKINCSLGSCGIGLLRSVLKPPLSDIMLPSTVSLLLRLASEDGQSGYESPENEFESQELSIIPSAIYMPSSFDTSVAIPILPLTINIIPLDPTEEPCSGMLIFFLIKRFPSTNTTCQLFLTPEG